MERGAWHGGGSGVVRGRGHGYTEDAVSLSILKVVVFFN